MSVSEIYRELERKSCVAMECLLADGDTATAFTKAHNFSNDYQAIGVALSNRYESHLIELAIKEYDFALLALATGTYRNAFAGLRLFFELSLAAIYFSAHEIDYRLWLAKSKDIYWSSLTHLDTGVFSNTFSTAFNADFSDERMHYQNLASSVYRECSEYVHGNAHTHANLPVQVEYDQSVVSAWCDKADTIQLVVAFAFAMRYVNHLPPESFTHAEPLIRERLGHLSAVQAIFQAAH